MIEKKERPSNANPKIMLNAQDDKALISYVQPIDRQYKPYLYLETYDLHTLASWEESEERSVVLHGWGISPSFNEIKSIFIPEVKLFALLDVLEKEAEYGRKSNYEPPKTNSEKWAKNHLKSVGVIFLEANNQYQNSPSNFFSNKSARSGQNEQGIRSTFTKGL